MSGDIKSITQVDTLKEREVVKQLSCLAALKERRGDVVCFTPALLVTHGKMPVDPAREFATRFPADADKQPFCVELPEAIPPFFSGLGRTLTDDQVINWDRRLYAIHAERAKLCFDFLGGIGLHNGDAFFASAVTYQIDIPDPLATLQSAVIPVHIFGVLHNNNITYIAPSMLGTPFVTTVDAATQIMRTSKFQINDTTEQVLNLFRGES